MRPIVRGNVPTRITIGGKVQETAVEQYGFFMGALINRIGEYCSYCEVSLGANLAVEHVLPKAVFPNAETDWTNFVLACVNCNSRKGSKLKSRDGYYWPDDTSLRQNNGGFNTYSMMEYYIGQAAGDNVVLVRPRANSGAVTANVQAIIDLVKLNNYAKQDSDPQMSDRRVWNRTNTWKIADSMAKTLSGYYLPYAGTGNDVNAIAQAADNVMINALKSQIKMAALAAGFWSVWVTVFQNYSFINDLARTALLKELFFDTFPGTNLAAF